MTDDSREALLRTGLSVSLENNMRLIRAVMNAPLNGDVTLREFELCGSAACAVFLDGMAGREAIDRFVLEPCMARQPAAGFAGEALLDHLAKRVLTIDSVRECALMGELTEAVLSGGTALLVEGAAHALLLETRAYEKRAVGGTRSESVVQGPHEAFVENLKTNVALVRRIVRSDRLVAEFMKVGTKLPTQVAMLYLSGTARGDTVGLVRRRLQGITALTCPGSGYIQQLIEDHPFSLFPQMLQTERPDRTAACLSEGQVAIIAEGSPYALIAPVSLFHLLHTSDDTFMRWPYAVFLRSIRMFGALVALFLPALYVAITTYHVHMIPLNLLTSIAETRARVPFPVVVEIAFMEASFYLLNEAGTRVPSQLGSALGIVGAVILGQAAVEASIISPILIIVVALTGLGGYSIPDYGVSVGMQLLRMCFVALAALWGLYGLCLGVWLLCAYLGWMKSFGEPFLAPAVPYRPRNGDLLIRQPLKTQRGRGFCRTIGAQMRRGRSCDEK